MTRSCATLALEADVQKIRSSHYPPTALVVAGALYDVRTGRINVLAR